MNQPLLDVVAFQTLAETGPSRAGRLVVGQASQQAWALGLSLFLHLLAAAAILGYGLFQGGWGPGASSGPLVLTVNLSAWPGTEEQDGGADVQKAADNHEETPAAEPPKKTEVPTLEEESLLNEPDPLPKEPEISLSDLALGKAASPPIADQILAPAPPRAERWKARAGPASPAGKTGPAESSGSGAGSNSTGGGGGGGNSAGYLKGNYEYIKKRIRQHLVYSPQAKRLGIQGTVTVAFMIGADGQARNAAVSQTSGHTALDESALKAVHSASPFPPPPEAARIVVPISFSLK